VKAGKTKGKDRGKKEKLDLKNCLAVCFIPKFSSLITLTTGDSSEF
jgi:hypothetical protein